MRKMGRLHHIPWLCVFIVVFALACDDGTPEKQPDDATPADANPSMDTGFPMDSAVPVDGQAPIPDRDVDGETPPVDAGSDAGPDTETPDGGGPCVDPFAVLTETAWSEVFVGRGCLGCHQNGGAARLCVEPGDPCADFVLRNPADLEADETEAQVMRWNFEQITEQAHPFEGDPDGRPYILVKATGGDAHGGGLVLTPDRGTEEEFTPYEAMLALLDAIANEETEGCGEVDDDQRHLDRIQYDSVQSAWRQLTIQVAGRLPTVAEREALANALDAGTEQAQFEALFDGLLGDPGMHLWLKEVWNDIFLFRGIWQQTYNRDYEVFNAHDYGARLWSDMASHNVGEEDGCIHYAERFGYPSYGELSPVDMCNHWTFTERGIAHWTVFGAIESPLELIAHVIEQRLPFSEIVTGQTILMNYYTSNVFFGTAQAPTNLFVASDVDKPTHADLKSGSTQIFDLEVPDHRFFLPFEHMRMTRVTSSRNPNDVPPSGRIVEKPTQEFTRAGILTTPAFLSRFPSNRVNRNRHRAWQAMRLLLGHDILDSADRDVDLTAVIGEENPTVDVEACSVCHVDLDPVAALFQTFSYNEGSSQGDTTNPDERERPLWPRHLHGPGSGPIGNDRDVYEYESDEAIIGFLARHIVADRRFPETMVNYAWKQVFGQARPTSAGDPEHPAYPIRRAIFNAQTAFYDELLASFTGNGLDMWPIYRALFTSPWYRIRGVELGEDLEDAAGYEAIARGGPVTPEHLIRTVEAVLGRPWPFRGPEVALNPHGHRVVDPNHIYNDFLLRTDSAQELINLMLGTVDEDLAGFFGGVDFFNTLERAQAMNSVMSLVVDRISNEFACHAVPFDFHTPAADRVFFRDIDVGAVPDDDATEEVFRETIVVLFQRFLGVTVDARSEDVDEGLGLWRAAYEAGREIVAAPSGRRLLEHCRVPPANGGGLENDPDYTIRAWMAVITYLVRQPEFIMTGH